MFPPDDAPPAARLSRWLDWWLEPRWRAVLTWLGLAALMEWVVADLITVDRLVQATRLSCDFADRAFHLSLKGPLLMAQWLGPVLLFSCWFEPLMLRLNPVRGLAWIGLRTLPPVLYIVLRPDLYNFMWLVLVVPVSVLSVLVLRGWRSRPWMSAIGAALMLGADYYRMRSDFPTPCLDEAALALPYAVVLLYGTRLLTPEERERRGA